MLLQKARIGKTAVFIVILILLLGTVSSLPLFLRADESAESDHIQYLPVIFHEADGTPDPGAEVTATPTSPATATSTNTPLPPCDIVFDSQVYAGEDTVDVTGDVGTEVTIINLSDGDTVLGSGTLIGPVAGHACEGFASITLSPPLNVTNAGNILLAVDLENPDNNDTIVVFGMPTVTPSSTPTEPYLIAMPNCGPGPDMQFTLQGFNWPTDQSLMLAWEGAPQIVWQAGQHTGSFSTTWTFSGLANGIYTVSALSGISGATASTQIHIPCGILPTSTPTPTETPTPTSTPVKPYIVIMPDCGPGPTVFFLVQGYYWPVNESITLTWNDNPMMVMQANQHTGSFSFGWTFEGMTSGLYKVSAISGTSGITSSDYYTIPCGASITPTATQTPQPADLVIGQPVLISTPPVIAYQPLAFEVPITNTGGVDINTQFFVDLLFDPTPVHYRDVYTAVSNLAGNSSMTLTITSTVGLANYLGPHQITGVVDSLDHVVEANEDNNLSPVLEIPFATPGNTPTNTPEPVGTGTISGIVRRIQGKFIPMERAAITAIDEANSIPIASTYSDANGYYELNNLPDNKTYTIQACIIIDSDSYFGVRSGQTPPNMFADIILNKQPCP